MAPDAACWPTSGRYGLDRRTHRSDGTQPVATPGDSPEVLERLHANLDLVDVIARQVAREIGGVVEFDDLRAMGRKGLLEAARRFDPSKGVTFPRYANYRIRGAIYDGVRTSAPLPRRIHAKVESLQALLQVTEGAGEEWGPSTASLMASQPAAADERLSTQLAEMATAMAMGFVAARSDYDERQLGVAEPSESPEELVAEAELRALVLQAIADLPNDERTLIERHYLGGERLDHVAASLGLSKSWGSRLHTRAISRLTKRLRALK